MQVVIKVIGNYSYQTSRCLGEGVYGKVYEGMERETKEKVAIKKIDLNIFTNDKYLENAIFSEIYLLKRFNHPNIVRFKDVLSSKNSLYIITQFCKNGDLKELIKRKRFKEEEALDIMRQLLCGFGELVREKIIHRDLKPANILINQGVYKIGDFGFAKYVDNFGSQMLRSCVGSPIYMAPQILERTQYTTKCDIWSLGIIFYEMIHGYPPWKAKDQMQLLKYIRNNPISQLLRKSTLSSEGMDFLKRCLAFSEEERISWNQLFDFFGGKEKSAQSSPIEPRQTVKDKQKQRINSTYLSQPSSFSTSNNYSSNQQPQWKVQMTPQTSHSHLSQLNSSPTIPHQCHQTHNHSHSATPENPKRSYSSNLTINTNTNSNSHSNIVLNSQMNSQMSNKHDAVDTPTTLIGSNRKITFMENISQWRQFLIYYHFYTLELFVNLPNIQNILNRSEMLGKLVFSIANLVKNRSTYGISMTVIQSKSNKTNEDFYKKIQSEHEIYEMAFNDIQTSLDRGGYLKQIKNEYTTYVGLNEIITEERMEKMESFMVAVATQSCQFMCEEVKKRLKSLTNRDYVLVQALENVLDVMRLSLGKAKFFKDLQEEEKDQIDDIKEYVSKVFGKVDRLFANL